MLQTRAIEILKRSGWVAHLLLIASGAYVLADTGNTVFAHCIRTIPSIDDPHDSRSSRTHHKTASQQRELNAIADRNLLGAKRENLSLMVEVTDPEDDAITGRDYEENELRPCSLVAELRGTLVAQSSPLWSMAVFYDRTKRKSEVFSINEGSNEIATDAVLVDIRTREAVVRRHDHFELCKAGTDKPRRVSARTTNSRRHTTTGGGITRISEGNYVVERQELDNSLSNLSRVATQARIVPSFRGGKPVGFKVFSIKPNSIYKKIGLRNGDVIRKVNGYEINSPDKALEIYQKLKDASTVSLELQRRGRNKHFTYTIRG